MAFCGFFGFFVAVSRLNDPLIALSQQASLLTGLGYTWLAVYPLVKGRPEPRSPWLRGALTVLLMLVCVTYMTLLGGNLSRVDSLFEHMITPVAVLADFLLVGRNQRAVRWWYPVTWLGYPLLYLIYYVAADLTLYGRFLNPGRPSFPGVVAGFIVALTALGYLLYAFGRAKTRISPPGYAPNG
ncbi:multisubunit Na+/H+ antiporter MnhE subunit [Kibdelosporangium banguiense]|uniref:Multisubunit Na+/H+ antiporter MnhE subunit n=1 Tax=Kibdelosporangium banguiense TaxID=1365924 RepID=A0ABS4U1Z3_9PSEU|nr:hypothetical protein [Kibdelosporangium banguiense]MBP2330234.1 multisubunit Na+/H+ antiporter MnhE subunit [Kibdelosporangium banguiense]